MRTASVGAARARGRGARTAAPSTRKALTTEERGEDVMDDFGWQQDLPPFPITALYPDLFNLDPSAFPQQALLSPEALQIIFTNSLHRGYFPTNIYETVEENTNDSEHLKDNFEESKHETHNEILEKITEPKKDCNILPVKDSENCNQVNNGVADDSATKAYESILTSVEANAILATETEEFKLNKDCLKPTPADHTQKEKEQLFQDELEPNEHFEDACDDSVLPLLGLEGRVLNEKGLKMSMSKESLASSGEQCFEDTLPDISMLTDPESPNISERKGKYNKTRAPAPPDTKEEIDVTGTEMSHESMKPDTLHYQSHESTYSKPRVEEKTYEYPASERAISPSPSLKSKKDGSNFTRFLPKSSLFNLFGAKEDIQSNKATSGVRRSPSNVSVKSSQIPSSGTSSPSSVSNIEYLPDSNDRTPKKDENMSSPKLRLRQMSQSPSRKRHHDVE